MLTTVEQNGAVMRGHLAPWTSFDWDLIAVKMIEDHPTKHFKSYSQVTFTLDDFEDAMDQVITQGRQKAFGTFDDIRSSLFDAFQRVSRSGKPIAAAAAPVPESFLDKRKRVSWTPGEWEIVVLEYHKLYPGELDARLPNVTGQKIRAAQEGLSDDRRRTFNDVTRFPGPALQLGTVSSRKYVINT